MKNKPTRLSDEDMKKIYVKNRKFAYDISELVKIFPGGEHYQIITEENASRAPLPSEIFVGVADKNEAKRQVFMLLEAESGYRPPWGILTGVRPGKITDELMRQNQSESRIQEILTNEYWVMPEKASLLMEVAQNQKRFYRKAEQTAKRRRAAGKEKEGISIYVGIPFCPTRCAYCSFPANARKDEAVKAYLEALFCEIKAVGEMVKVRELPVETVYIGGGTPTALTPEEMDRLLILLKEYGLIQEDCMEFTVEAGRPDTVTCEMMALLKQHGVSRVSVNPQTMRHETLLQIGRMHTPAQTRQAAAIAASSGIAAVNMDLIAGLPSERPSDFRDTLQEVIDFRPQNITVHTLAIKKSSRFRDEKPKTDPKDVEEMVSLSHRALQQAGYGAYYLYRQKYMSGNFENTGYALPGEESGYNIRIMAEKQTVIAMGAGGISKFYFPKEDRLERVPNVSNYEIYVSRIDEMIKRKRDFWESGKI